MLLELSIATRIWYSRFDGFVRQDECVDDSKVLIHPLLVLFIVVDIDQGLAGGLRQDVV